MIHVNDSKDRIDAMYDRLMKSYPRYSKYLNRGKRDVIIFALENGAPAAKIFASCFDSMVLGLHDDQSLAFDFSPRGTGEPTWAQPGSPGKVAVLEQRIAAGLELWHPGDFPGDFAARRKMAGSIDKIPARGKTQCVSID